MWYWKKNKNKNPIYCRSVREKIRYYQSRLNSSNPKIRQKANKNLYRLNRITNGKGSIDKTFMIKDKAKIKYISNKKKKRG